MHNKNSTRKKNKYQWKKSTTSPSSDQNKNKKQRSPCLGDIGFAGIQVVNGKKYVRKLEGGKCIEQARCIGYKAGFKSKQDRGNHERTCAMAQYYYKEKKLKYNVLKPYIPGTL